MPLYLTLSRGPRADRAEPVLASSDPAVIRAVLAAIGTLADADRRPSRPRTRPGRSGYCRKAGRAMRGPDRPALAPAARRACWDELWRILLRRDPDHTASDGDVSRAGASANSGGGDGLPA
jgi:hypothetical protein